MSLPSLLINLMHLYWITVFISLEYFLYHLFVFCQWKKVIQVWNDKKVNKWWLNLKCRVNYPFKKDKAEASGHSTLSVSAQRTYSWRTGIRWSLRCLTCSSVSLQHLSTLPATFFRDSASSSSDCDHSSYVGPYTFSSSRYSVTTTAAGLCSISITIAIIVHTNTFPLSVNQLEMRIHWECVNETKSPTSLLFDDPLGNFINRADLLTEGLHVLLHLGELLRPVSDPSDRSSDGFDRIPHPAQKPRTLFFMRGELLQRIIGTVHDVTEKRLQLNNSHLHYVSFSKSL